MEDLADWGEVVGARVSIHGLTGHTMTHAGCGRYEIEQDDDVQFHHDGPFEFTLFSNDVHEVSIKERNANVTKHMTECTKEFTYDGHKVMQRTFQRDGDRHFVFGSCEHHCPGFYEDVLTHYGTACPADEKSADTVLPENSAEANTSNCSPGTFTNTNGQCEECPIGTYADEKGQTTCKRCQPGQFNPFPEAQGCMACPDGYFQPNWGQQYCVACDSDAALGKKEFALQGASKRKLLGGWWNFTKDDDDGDEDQGNDVKMNHDQYHKFGAKSMDQCGTTPTQLSAEEYKKAQEAENAPNFDATPGSSNESTNDGPNGPAATAVLTGRTDKFGHCVCPGTKPKPASESTSSSASPAPASSSSEVQVDPVTHVVAGQPCGPCAAIKPKANAETPGQEDGAGSQSTPSPSSTTPPETDATNANAKSPGQEDGAGSQSTPSPSSTTPPETDATNANAKSPGQENGAGNQSTPPTPEQQKTATITSTSNANSNTNPPASDTLKTGETIVEQETKTETGSIVNVETEYTADGDMIKTTTVTNPSGASATTVMKVHNADRPVATCDEIEHGEYGVGYRGCQDKTRDGQQCINWADQYVADGEKPYDNANYPEGIEENPGNMCRNPADDKSGIWCFTGTDGSWQVCSPLMQSEAEK